MRRTTIAALITAGLLLTATACTGDEITSTPSKTGAAEAPAEQVEAEPEAEPTKAAAAKIGDTIALKGTDDGLKVDAVLKKWDANAKPGDEYTEASAGKRFVAAQFELTNTGTAPYSDSPANGAQVADADGQRFSSTFAEVANGPAMTSDANVPPGEKVLGWIVFEVPKASKIVTVQLALDSGFANQTGQWKIS
ncbi:DUF4352 domain-containing protein [Streptomyces microflavus]|uniref:DUF4352 domain-containing protein n=1 Tax=Streptomyces microflavus TaxID=1919 RepID=UPI00192BBF29|nr:DUF4352 domain-containing protein [Streptomyces microflavus]QQZ54133.1 DUF4352 domain-containing protein [Streptomyces microflavus]